MIQHNGPISGVASSEKFVATAGYDNQVILWDAKRKVALARGLHDHLANQCEISKDQKFLVSASSDYTARLWELPEMRLKTVFGEHTDDVEAIHFSPCGRMVATASQDSAVRVFSLDGQLLREFRGHLGLVQSCAWSADGTQIVSAGDDGTIRTWDVLTGQMLRLVQPEDVQTDSIAISSTGTVFAGNDAGELVRIVGESIAKLKVHQAGIKNLIISGNEQMIVTMSYDRKLALIDAAKLRVIKTIDIPALIWARSCVFASENTLVLGTFGSSYAKLDLQTEEWDFSNVEGTDCLNGVTIDDGTIYSVGDTGQVRSIAINRSVSSVKPNQVSAEMGSLCNFITKYQDRLVCGGHLGQVFDARTGENLITMKCPINKALQVGPYLVLGLYTGEIAICRDTSEGPLVLVGEMKVLNNAVKDLCADGMRLFCGGADRDIVVFDLELMRVISHREEAHDDIVNSCASLGQGHFVTVSRDLKLKVWEGTEPVASYQTPHNHSVKCAATSDDRRFIACGSYDGKIAIFDNETKKWTEFRRLTSAGISSVTFGEGSFWASSYDGRVYEVPV